MGEWKALKIGSGTGWKSIDRVAGTGWKALEWDSVPIDVGAACIDRIASQAGNYTHLTKENVANASGTITNVCIWMYSVHASDVFVGCFYLVSGSTYKCRSAANVGNLDVGENNKVVSLAVVAGDLIGIGSTNDINRVERDNGGDGRFSILGQHCIVDDETTYTSVADRTLSLYGTG